MLLLALLVGQSGSSLPGFGDLPLYQNASRFLVGAQAFVSFSSASAHGARGQNLTGHVSPAPEALCNCACFALPDMAYCQNTAKTTVGVSTFAYNSAFDGRWTGRALRYFAGGSPGAEAGRFYTSFLESARLPDGPGGAIYFEVAYTADVVAPGERSAELVRGHTGAVDCAAHALCDVQCAGVAQYEAWRKGCSTLAGAQATS
jgi:hypothetical protein